MKYGDLASHKNHPEYGTGKVINKEKLFGKDYYEVYFKDINRIIKTTGQDLDPVVDPVSLMSKGYFSLPDLFKLKTMAHQLETYLTGNTFISSVNFKIKPLPHQLLVLNFVLNQFKPRCLLADEVGLGKTIEAALIFEELKLRGIAKRILIITPAGLTHQWQEELKLKFSEEFYILDNEAARTLLDLRGVESNIWYNFDQVITSIDFLKPKKLSDELSRTEYEKRLEHNQKIYQSCIEADWDVVIIDEAHNLTKYGGGRETARYKLAEALSQVSPIFLLLTVTPHSGKTDVFHNLLRLIDPHLFYSKESLKPEIVKQVIVRNNKRTVVDMEGHRIFKNRITSICTITRDKQEDKEEKKLYNRIVDYVTEYYNLAKFEKNYTMIFLLMLYQRIVSSSTRAILHSLEKRHNKLQAIKDVSKRLKEDDLETILDLFGEEQLEFIEDNLVFLKNPFYLNKEIEIINDCIKIAKKRLKSGHDAKLRMLLDIINEVKERENNPDVKMIIFTEFIETQRYIQETLESLGYSTACINGKMDLEEKIIQKNKFKNKAQFLISTDAGGEGINLQFCSYMINYDLPWNPMRLEQRIGRIDRIGQENDVKVFNFVLVDTIEEHVRSILEEKLEIIKEEFGEDKLSDILSSLKEDFNFDQIYIETIVSRNEEENNLNEIAQQIYEKAQLILKEEKFLVPFTQREDNLVKMEKGIVSKIPFKFKTFVDLFLNIQGNQLHEYSRQENLYYFKNNFKTDKYGNHFTKVIFDPVEGMENEDAVLLSLKHGYIQDILNAVKKNGIVSSFYIYDSRFAGKEGLLGFWHLVIENNYYYKRIYYIPIFIEKNRVYNRRISRLFNNIENIKFGESFYLSAEEDIAELFNILAKEAERVAEAIFLEDLLEWQEKLEQRSNQLKEYYREKEKVIKAIQIDNIRESRLNAFKKEKEKQENELKEQAMLIPSLSCAQLAYIKYK